MHTLQKSQLTRPTNPIKDIPRIVKHNHGEIEYTANHEALEYFQSIEMTDEEFSNLTNNQPPVPSFVEEEEEICELV